MKSKEQNSILQLNPPARSRLPGSKICPFGNPAGETPVLLLQVKSQDHQWENLVHSRVAATPAVA